MEKYLQLASRCRTPGSYLRKAYKKDVLYYSYRYRHISITFAKQHALRDPP